jgi:septal ring factor EnvC (AmiA/AmiB activator)
MLRAAFLGLALAFGGGGAHAQSQAVGEALSAADALRSAIVALDSARSAADRVAALTVTIGAYERGLAGLRDGLRRAALREAEILADFNARSEHIGRILGVLSTMEQIEGPLLLLHPAGPLGSARSAMVLGSVTPALQQEAERLRADLAELAQLKALQTNAAATLAAGLNSAQAARTALSQAMSERTSLPSGFLSEPENLRRLLESADTLESFALGLAELDFSIGAPEGDFVSAKGGLPLPVQGILLRRMNESDAAGIRRPGIILATAPAALVTAPWPATIRYRGPLLDYGNVMIIEPAKGYLVVLAGLGTVYGEPGDVIAAGAPLGLMGGRELAAQDFGAGFVLQAQQGSSAGRSETLYMELRVGSEPVDPAEWFTID